MIYYIRGKVEDRIDNIIVIENNGIGYEVYIPTSSMDYIMENREDILLYINMMVREDDISLYGFISKEDKELFNKLLTVNGIGAKVGLAIMSTFSSSSSLKKAIILEDIDELVKVPGIGKKTAQRIILELKDKVGDMTDILIEDTNKAEETDGNMKQEAIEALIGLGYSKIEATSAISKALKSKEIDTVEELIRIGLSRSTGKF
ncbi:MAG: Holliday junction branch migration protein RuvA [Peptostreptococcales bacterium]